MKTIHTSTLRKIEDRFYREIRKLKDAANADAALVPIASELQMAWSNLYQECQRREREAAIANGGGELICTVFRPGGASVRSVTICRQMVLRRYQQEPDAAEYVDVLRAPIQDSRQLSYYMDMGGHQAAVR